MPKYLTQEWFDETRAMAESQPERPGATARMQYIVSGTPDEMRNSKDPLVHQFIFGLAEGPLTDRRRGGGYEKDLLTEAK